MDGWFGSSIAFHDDAMVGMLLYWSLLVLSTPYVYVGRKNAALEINPYWLEDSQHVTMKDYTN